MLPVGLIGTGVTLAFPTLTLLMLDRFPAVRGAAASVQATISLGVSALVSGLVAPLVDASPVLLASAAAAMTVTGYLLWTGYRRITPDIGPAGAVGGAGTGGGTNAVIGARPALRRALRRRAGSVAAEQQLSVQRCRAAAVGAVQRGADQRQRPATPQVRR